MTVPSRCGSCRRLASREWLCTVVCGLEENMDTRLKDKVAIVTGGARGIGAAFCEGLAAVGTTVVVADVLDGSAVAERIAERQTRSIYVHADVTLKDSVENLVANAVREFGTVDILVNNAGLFADLRTKPNTSARRSGTG